jgi:hypothetical protein
MPPSQPALAFTTATRSKLEHLPARVAAWCLRHETKIASHDGLPGPFHREHIFHSIGPHDTVAVVTPHGQVRLGKAVMVFPTHAVLNLGGAHGTPGIADITNTVYASRFKFS